MANLSGWSLNWSESRFEALVNRKNNLQGKQPQSVAFLQYRNRQMSLSVNPINGLGIVHGGLRPKGIVSHHDVASRIAVAVIYDTQGSGPLP
jgi:hypothetical protein